MLRMLTENQGERQHAQKIIDGHLRPNRLAGVENTVINFRPDPEHRDRIQQATNHDDRGEVMVAQTRAWIERSHA